MAQSPSSIRERRLDARGDARLHARGELDEQRLAAQALDFRLVVAQAVKLESGVGSTCTRRTPMATFWPGFTWKARCSGCVRVTSRNDVVARRSRARAALPSSRS